MSDLEMNPATLAMNSKSAGSVQEAAGNRPSVLEPKYDGIRLLVHVAEGGVRMYARSGNSKTGKLPHIDAELLANLPVGTWIDGEAVAFNADGTQDWGGAQSVLGSDSSRVMAREHIHLVVFDLISHGGLDARGLTLAQRRELLEMVFAGGEWDKVVLSEQVEATDENHARNLERGFEGSMVKHLDAKYQSGKRSGNSLKLKATDTVDAVVTGFEEPTPGSWIDRAGLFGALTFVHWHEGQEIEGKCSGMTVAERQRLAAMGSDLVGQVVEVSYMTRMPGGKIRHPQFKRIRTDKTAEECRS